MTTEERLRKLEDALTVEAELLSRHERLDEERHARIDENLGALAGAIAVVDEKLEALATIAEEWAEKMNELRDSQRTTQAALDRLIGHMDSFIKGQSGNGRRKRN